MAPLYRPPTKVVTTEIPYLAMVTQADPEFERNKHRESQRWQFRLSGGGPHYVDPQTQGAYNRRDNSYAVGQPYGGLDPLIEAALAPTVGNTVPGLYQGVDDDNGWA